VGIGIGLGVGLDAGGGIGPAAIVLPEAHVETKHWWNPEYIEDYTEGARITDFGTGEGLWIDSVGGKSYGAGSDTTAPTATHNALDGRSAATVDGTDDFDALDNGISTVAGPFSLFVVVNPRSNAATRYLFGEAAGAVSRFTFNTDGSIAITLQGVTVTKTAASAFTHSTAQLIEFRRDANDIIRVIVNGVDKTTETSTAQGGDWIPTRLCNYSGAANAQILHEAVIMDGDLTNLQLSQMYAYFDSVYPSLSITQPPASMASIPELVGWYKPESLPTSGSITAWQNTANPGTFDLASDEATDPVVGTGTNGVRSVLFSQVTTEALTSEQDTNYTQPLHYFFVAMKSTGIATVSLSDSSLGTNRIAIYDPSGNNNMYVYAGTQQASNLIALNSTWFIHEYLVDGASTRCWLGASEGTIGNPGTGSVDGLRIGLTGIDTGPWDGEVCEVLFFDGELTEVERLFVRNYLAAKYSLAA
jgi:hypothetical protein